MRVNTTQARRALQRYYFLRRCVDVWREEHEGFLSMACRLDGDEKAQCLAAAEYRLKCADSLTGKLDLLETALLQLPAGRLPIVKARYMDGGTWESVAADFGLPVGTIKRIVSDALQRLTAALPL